MIPMDYEKIEEARYENMWRSMKGKLAVNSRSYRSEYPAGFLPELNEFIEKEVGGRALLDVGCGNGRNAIFFAKKGYVVSGIDISSEAIKLAKTLAKRDKVDVSLEVGSVFDLPYGDVEYDAVLDCGCLHHLRKSQWSKYLRNILRVIKSSGIYCLYCFSDNTSPYSVKNKVVRPKNRNWNLVGKHYNHFFSSEEVNDFFGKYFEISEQDEIVKDLSTNKFRLFFMSRKH